MVRCVKSYVHGGERITTFYRMRPLVEFAFLVVTVACNSHSVYLVFCGTCISFHVLRKTINISYHEKQ